VQDFLADAQRSHGERSETCPVAASEAWVTAAGIDDGPLFRPIGPHGHVGTTRLSGNAVALAVKRAAGGSELDPAPKLGGATPTTGVTIPSSARRPRAGR
jgi:hypothetical protein